MKPIAAFFWRKLDHPGHDSCRLFRLSRGWRLTGASVFFEADRPCYFQYDVVTDAAWRTRRASVTGYLGNRAVDLRISGAGRGRWKVDGVVQSNLSGCVDVDLGFTPATNLIVIRRLALAIGERAEAPAAYLAFPRMRFVKLPQSYRRTGKTRFAYAAPTVGYAGTLEVSRAGAVVHYPGLFALVTSADGSAG